MASGVVAAALLVPQGVIAPPVQASTPPGPCEDGWVAPTPTAVTVTSVPITVASTADDYFVLYRKFEQSAGVFIDLPVSVTLGESGTTTVTENLAPLAADQYRLDKYQVANPADIDGDCFDDISELNDFGKYNPVQRTLPIGAWAGGVAMADRARFEKLSFKGNKGAWTDEHLNNLEFVKFWVLDIDSEWPRLYFQNTQRNQVHNFLDPKMYQLKDCCFGSTVRGVLVYHPNVVAPDGSLGMYRIEYQPYDAYGFRRIELTYELIAAAMPFLENNLAYYPGVGAYALNKYNKQKALYDASRVNILHTKDIMPDVEYTAYNKAVGYGLLRELAPDESAGPRDVVILKALPNDLPRAAGIISTVPQTPLSHVNLRAIQNGVPNAFVRDAFDDDDVTDLIGKHVRYSTFASGFTLQAATKAEVDAHHAASRPDAVQTPQRDLSVQSIASLADIAFDDWTAFGVKAANVAELSNLAALAAGVAPDGFAVPFYFYDEFMKQATLGEETVLGKKKAPDAEKITLAAGTTLAEAVTAMLAHSHFQADYDAQEEMLDDLRKAIKKATAPAWIITELEKWHAKFPGQSLRYRSSTNNEDLPDFNGAGLYDSKTQDPDETADEGIDKSIKAVWASLWNFRAFLERDHHRVDHTATAMGVLVHPNYSDERANGVAVSVDPVTGIDGMHYINTQLGEDLVTNPEANSLPEQLLLDSTGTPTVLARSNLAQPGQLLMSDAQMVQLRNSLDAIHSHFAGLYNVQAGDDFAIEIEFKITAADKLAIKQARPWVFPDTPLAATWIPDAAVVAQVQAEIDNHVNNTGNQDAANRGTKVLAGINGEAGGYTSAQCRKVAQQYRVLARWKPWCDEIERLENFLKDFSSFRPPPTSAELASLVRAKADGHSSASASARLHKVADGIEGIAGGFTAAECRDTAAHHGVSDVWKPWCDEIERRENAAVVPPPPVVEVSIAAGPAIAEGNSAVFTLSASPVPSQTLTVSVAVTQSGDWISGSLQSSVTIPANTGSATLSVPTVDDTTDEADGSVTATLQGGGTAYTVAAAPDDVASVAVSDDDDPSPVTPEIAVTADSAGVTEGQMAGFTVTASPPPAVSLDVSVSVDQSGDFTAGTGTRTVTISAGASTVAVSVPTVDDSTDEADGSVTATVVSASGYTVGSQSSATVAVSDDDDPSPVVDTSAFVADAALVDAVREKADGHSNASAAARLRRVADGMEGVAGGFTAAGCRDTAAHHGVSGVWRPWCDEIERRENWTPSVDDKTPPPPPPEISISAGGGVTEGQAAVFTVTASPPPPVSLDVSVSVDQSGDYTSGTGARTVTVGSSGTATLTVATTNDTTDEADGAVTATIATGQGYTVSATQASATVAVSDDDDPPPPPPTPEISISAGTDVTEGGDAVFTVTASPPPAVSLDVSVSVDQSGDFTAGTGTRAVTISAGASTVAVSVATVDDSTDEADGSVTATVVSASGYTVGSQSSATVAVSDDDDPPPPPEVSISAAGDVTEGFAAVFAVSVSPVQTQPLTVALAVTQSGDWISDAAPTSVTIPANTGSVTLSVPTVDDTTDEPDGALTTVLVADSAYTIGMPSSATVAVADDDLPEAGSLDCSDSGVQVSEITVAEPAWSFAFASFEVTLCGDNWGQTMIDYHVEHIETGAADFGYMPQGTLVFNPHQTAKKVHVMVSADSVAEGDETFALVFGTVYSYRHIDLGHGRIKGTITDNN